MVQLHCPLRNRQPQSDTASVRLPRIFDSEEWFENLGEQYRWNSGTVVPHRDGGVTRRSPTA